MENQQKAQATDTDDFQGKQFPEYRFVFRRAQSARRCCCLIAILTIIIAGFLYFLSHAFTALLVIIIGLPEVALLHSFSKRSITLDQKGITFRGTGLLSFSVMPRYYGWDEFQQIRKQIFAVLRDDPFNRFRVIRAQDEMLIFIDRYGKKYLFMPGTYVGIGHALSLAEATEQFVGPIKILDEAEIAGIPVLALFSKADKEIVHVVCAIGVGVVLALLALAYKPFHLLDHALVPGFQWSVGIIVGAMAFWHMRRVKRLLILFVFILSLALVSGSLAGFLSGLFLSKLPALFGEEEAIVFRMSEENEEEQHWMAIADAGLTFTIRIPPRDFAYKGVGTERSMMVYRGPYSLNALPDSEYRALFQSSGAKQGD